LNGFVGEGPVEHEVLGGFAQLSLTVRPIAVGACAMGGKSDEEAQHEGNRPASSETFGPVRVMMHSDACTTDS
jgi:hypothetical protein